MRAEHLARAPEKMCLLEFIGFVTLMEQLLCLLAQA